MLTKIKNIIQNLVYNTKKMFSRRKKEGDVVSKKPLFSKKTKKIIQRISKGFLAIFLIFVITGSVVLTVISIYVMKNVDATSEINLRDLKLNYTAIVYAKNEKGEDIEVKRVNGLENRVWVDLNQIPKHVSYAFISVEDERFLEHTGVDWKRTVSAFANLFFNFFPGQPGGSTITQQLIKNITKEDDVSVTRKVEEIFRALNLEKNYSKEDILEAYLNYIGLGNNVNGVQAAANYYFGKQVQDLTIAEAASIAAITSYPVKFDPYTNPKNNKKQQEYVLEKMYDLGRITKEQYNEALAQELYFKKKDTTVIQSYFVDNLINEVINDLVEQKGYTRNAAEAKIFYEGYRIYTTMDTKIQTILEEKYVNDATFASKTTGIELPQSAMIVMDYNGEIKAVVGGRGVKTGNRVLNRAVDTTRQCGSSIKPLSVYSLAIERNLIHFSTKITDSPIDIVSEGKQIKWPVNAYKGYLGSITIDEAIQRSTNTIPVKLCQTLTPQTSFDFLTKRLGFTTLVKSKKLPNGDVANDINLSGMAIGGLTDGVSLKEMASAFEIFGNKGVYTKAHSYTKILDKDGNEVLTNVPIPVQAISEDTSMVINRLLQRSVYGPYGTAAQAKIPNQPTAVKTGTTDSYNDRYVVGLSPYYVAAVWTGHDQPKKLDTVYVYSPAKIFGNIMTEIHKTIPTGEFYVSPNVVEHRYCPVTGLLANDNCPASSREGEYIGYYRSSNLPEMCTTH